MKTHPIAEIFPPSPGKVRPQTLTRNFTAGLLGCLILWSCTAASPQPSRPTFSPPPTSFSHPPQERTPVQSPVTDRGSTYRVVTEEELIRWEQTDPGLSFNQCREILSRLNTKAGYHISDDLRRGRALLAPNDFRAFKDWTPLPGYAPKLAEFPKAILVVKEFPFLGWYEKGFLTGDAPACIGPPGEDTRAGRFVVIEKDADHKSRSYRNDLGEPAWMPWALRVYDTVWIHAGDVSGKHCSHGCIILPVKTAEKLFHWADPETPVVIVQSLSDL